jgi:hypothetical protein
MQEKKFKSQVDARIYGLTLAAALSMILLQSVAIAKNP